MKNNLINLRLILLSLLLLYIACFGCKADLITSDVETDLNYPTTLHPLSEEKIQQLQNEFDALNKNKPCSKINKYGYIGNDRCHRAYQLVPISQDRAFVLAVSTILKNARYVNITDSVTLIASGYKVIQSDTASTKWKIIFGPQIYNGFELPFTWITVRIYGNEPYTLTGHWYSDIYIPSRYTIDKEKAKQKVVGEKLIWGDIAGTPQEFVITDESISDNISNAIFPLEKENSIELRVIWKIPILFSSDFVGWHIYIDVITGEIVKIIQEFMT